MIRYDFSDKVVLVTGSSRGIGAEIIRQFSNAHATCVIHYWNDADGVNQRDAQTLADELQVDNSNVKIVTADVRNFEEVSAMMADIGSMDVLVNNAGILKDRSLRKMTADDWNSVIDTNLTGVFNICRSGVETLRDGGRIINIASVAGLVGIHGQSNYAAAKAGVIGLTRSLAKELARRQITVNAVAPGVVQTAMIGDIKPELLSEYQKQIPLGRIGTPSDIANAVLFLASEESGYITGQVLPITGGWLA